jgi:ribose transport system substrate-binding protein
MSRQLTRCIHLLGLGLGLAALACGSTDEATPKKQITRVEIPDSAFKPVELESTIDTLVHEIGKTDPKPLQLGVVLKELTGYWEPVKVGANRAFGELGVSGVVLAPTEDTEEAQRNRQVEILQERADSGYDGLGLAPLADILQPEIDRFADAGTPVVTIDSDLPGSKRTLYIGTINYEAGHTAGSTLSKMVGTGAGSVIILGHDDEPTWPDGYNRTMGAKDVLEAAGYTVTVRKTNWATEGEAEDVDYMTDALETLDPPVVGMLSMFSPTFRCARAAEAAGLTGDDVTIVGFDFEPETLSYMQSGLIKATHVQRQYYFGYLVPYVLYSMKVLGAQRTLDILAPEMVDESRFNAGIDVVRADQVDEYNSFLDSLGIGG